MQRHPPQTTPSHHLPPCLRPARHDKDIIVAVNPRQETKGRVLPPTIQRTRSAPNRLHITLTNNPGGLLIVSENWLPGWRAQSQLAIRNSQLPILRANLTLLAVPLPPGDLTLTLVYWPASLTWGFALTGGALLILCAGLLYHYRRKPRV